MYEYSTSYNVILYIRVLSYDDTSMTYYYIHTYQFDNVLVHCTRNKVRVNLSRVPLSRVRVRVLVKGITSTFTI